MVFGLDLSGRMAVVTGAGGILCGMFARTPCTGRSVGGAP